MGINITITTDNKEKLYNLANISEEFLGKTGEIISKENNIQSIEIYFEYNTYAQQYRKVLLPYFDNKD